ncbi:MAG TPA: FHA domain-containing serine/threonine-protein kinase [Ktedonobacterales bacterium]|nr:FHA domain-containing serine/threonine-protein kinase [Ktedonobacterales bacterium]
MLGRVLKGRYKLIDERGNGSMATVYLGRDLETNRVYAVKLLSRQAAAEHELVERFQREFELLSRLAGPHVVSPVDFGDEKGTMFIVMDYVDGHTLKPAVQTGGPVPQARAIDVIQQAASGVASAAEKGIVHRDVKPQNLLLSADGVVKLTDFGLARSHESKDITVTGFFVGTPFYVAPEQVENSRRVDVRADLYSLACVFFEVLTGRVPYEGERAWDVVMLHLKAPLPSVRALRPELPVEYDNFMQRALAKKPEDRYQTPAEFTQALDALHALELGAEGAREGLIGTLVAKTDDVRLPLAGPDLVLGRQDPQRGYKPDVDLLAIDHQQTVSRRHARLTRRAGRFYIEDLNAYNRTRVNGLPLVPHQEQELHDGDTVRLGNVELRFEVGPR